MTAFRKYYLTASISMALAAYSGAAVAQDAPIVQPGAPGKASQALDAKKAIEIANNSYSDDDVQFMQDMIPHHNQAVQMAALVAGRTNMQELIDIAGRIDASQADEIRFMSEWLAARGESVPEPTAHEGMNMSHEMAGMASPAQMAALAKTSGTDFDRMFLELMIAHHKGAITMVNDLLSRSGSAYDPVLFDFVSDITNDQTSEINRMSGMLVGLSDDPRAGLKAGFRDAGQAAMNLELLASLPRPAGFFDPENPADLPPVINDDSDEAADDTEEADVKRGERSPFLSFSNTDMAFAGDKLVVGSYHGFNVYQLQDGGMPKLYSSIVCPGGQGDISIVGDLLIMSVEQTRGRVDCGRQGISQDVSPDRFRGLRIFDISDLARPRQVGQVQTCRGSHTHSVVSGPGKDGKIVVYNSGTSSVRSEEELAGCIAGVPGDDRTALFRIDVIEIPVDDPSRSRIVDSPAVFADAEGRVAGLWQGGDHGANTQETSETDQCHDITVFPEAKIAAGACSGNGIIFDISEPLEPKRIDVVTDPGFAYWHSATFNNDGTKVLFTDEWGGGGRPRCLAHDPKNWGADVFYDIVDRKLEYRGRFKIPAPQSETENCVAHNGSVVPVPGRDIFVQAWYQGGLSVIDFTDSSNPVEIAYFDRGPIDEDVLVTGGFWSTYWYNGKIYGSEIVRGLDVMSLVPSEYLTANEIAAASVADQGKVFNPQQQFKVSWPAEPVVARAYIDQLARDSALSASMINNLNAALDRAQASLEKGGNDGRVATELNEMASGLKADSGNITVKQRLSSLGSTLNGIAARLR